MENLITELSDKKIGLVLGGGGAKGAYHAGCLKALQKNDLLNFEVICGTSIGAITALAIATNRVNTLINFWKGISLHKIFQPSMTGFLILPITIYANLLNYLSYPKNLVTYLAMLVTIWVQPLIFFLLGNYFQNFEIISFALYAYSFLTFLYFTTLLFRGFAHVHLDYRGRKIMSWIQNKANLSNSRKYEKVVGEILGNDLEEIKFNCPAYVTLAKRHYWFDPDRPSFYPDVTDGHFHDIHRPMPLPRFLPHYFEISNCEKQEIISKIVGSASIPYLMPNYYINEDLFVDGGIVDNLPVNKALEFNCDYLIVINLSKPFSVKEIVNGIQNLKRAFYISELSVQTQYELYLNWLIKKLNVKELSKKHRFWYQDKLPKTQKNEIISEMKIENFPKIILVQPSKKIGGWIKGTLNFGKRKAKYLMNLGEKDMNNALSSLPSLPTL